MKPLAVLAAAAGATVVLAGCTATSGSSAAQSGTSPSAASPSAASTATARHAPAAIACPKSYGAWKNGPGQDVITAVNAVVTASKGVDIQAQEAALKKAAPAIDAAASHPIPACADPKGYWDALMLHVNAAAESLKSATGTKTLTLALKSVPQLDRELKAEVKRTTGVS
jgi:hypothetical protein